MKVPNFSGVLVFVAISLSRLQNEGSQLSGYKESDVNKSIKATERRFPTHIRGDEPGYLSLAKLLE